MMYLASTQDLAFLSQNTPKGSSQLSTVIHGIRNKISDLALNIAMEKRYSKPAPTRGGARPGAGRPRGSGNKVKLEDLLDDIETTVNMPYTQRIALNYAMAIDRSDWARVENYDKALLNKLVADRQEIEITDSEDVIAVRQAAFAAALAKLSESQDDTK